VIGDDDLMSQLNLEGSLQAKIAARMEPLGQERVEVLNGYSAHGDRGELGRWLDLVRGASPKPPPVWLVHGEPPAQEALAAQMRERGHAVNIPGPGDVATL
jgi:metallo-beta-lactamase family protein